MSDSEAENDARAIDYIMRTRHLYPRAQIDAELLNRGYERAVIDEFWIGIEEGLAERGLVQGEERELRDATQRWTAPFVVRTYESNPRGESIFAHEAAILARHEYEPTMQSAEGSHIHAGRLLLTGGLSVFAGGRGIRSKGKLTVTYRRVAEERTGPVAPLAQSDPIDQIRKLAELRDEGVLTADEFEAKKADLLSRM